LRAIYLLPRVCATLTLNTNEVGLHHVRTSGPRIAVHLDHNMFWAACDHFK
jgi:hypothetical protein